MRRLRVASCQINTVVGDLDGNVDRILASLAEAQAGGADVAVFPEMAVCGYPVEDLVLKTGFVEDCEEALSRVAAATTGSCAAVVGYVSGNRNLHNSVALCANGQVITVHHKRLLPNYSVFDENRYFTPGADPLDLVEINGVRCGIVICEDLWSPTGPILEQARGGAEVILCPNASPFRQGKALDRDMLVSTRATDNSVFIVYTNQVGGQDELVFDGGSVIFNPEGRLIARAPQFSEDLMFCDLDVVPTYRKRRLDPRGELAVTPELPIITVSGASEVDGAPIASPIAPMLSPEEELWNALVVGTHDYVVKNGFREVGVALSGGIDSTIVTVLAADALGPENVHCVLMPSRFSSDHSVADAEKLCANLGVESRILPIEPAHASMLEMLAPSFGDRDQDTTEENLQSRIRGVMMMALSNKLGWLILTTGNKSETSVGYSTLYGDTAGGFAVIKDLWKTQIYHLCRWRNDQAGTELIPENVISKPPSAELRPGQRDDQSLPPYEVLDAILALYVENDLTGSEIKEKGYDPPIVDRVVRLVDVAEYKRRQNPPGVRLSSKAFGRDRRMPMTNHYRG